MKKFILLGVGLVAGLLLAACSTPQTTAVEKEVTREVKVEVTRPVEVTVQVPVTVEPVAQAPFADKWAASAHAAKDTEPFMHWNEESPAEVPPTCARCHSSSGYLDYIGADGTAAGSVENPGKIEDVITCETCHNDTTRAMTSVTFPSGATVTGLDSSARCLTCHQGRESKVSVDAAIEKAGVADEDTVSADLGFRNIHYYAAGVARFGTEAKGGYEYEGKAYDVRFAHVQGMQSCKDCHDTHSLEIKLDTCAACHTNVKSEEDLRDIRMRGSERDYDGDGDVEEGIAHEIEGLQEALYGAIQAYGSEVAGTAIGYNGHAYPYFFADPNADGQIADDEAIGDNAYKAWTPRLLKAAYNYQVSLKDPGAFAHGGKYVIELLYDSIEDLNTKLASPVDMSAMHRLDAGHFASSEPAWRKDDTSGVTSGSCAKCHSSNGLAVFVANNANVAVPAGQGLACVNCHVDMTTFDRIAVNTVRFPSGKSATFGEGDDNNLCITCHQGRESTVSVDNAIKTAGVGDNEVSDKLSFRNIHYFAAGATLFGGEVQGGYQFAGQEYAGKLEHGGLGPTDCISCHTAHELEVQVDTCQACHRAVETVEDTENIRMSDVDFDGDGDVTEGLKGEITTLQEALYAAIQKYGGDTAGAAIAYDAHNYPYFFADTNANGTADEGEAVRDNSYKAWTPSLLRAAYNYQYSQKDPGAFAHNGKYVIELLIDSIKAVGGDTSAYTRP